MFRGTMNKCFFAFLLAGLAIGTVPMAGAATIPYGQVSYTYDSATMPWENGSTDSTGLELSDTIVATPSGEAFTPNEAYVQWAANAYNPANPAYGIVTFDLDDSSATKYSMSSVVVNTVTSGGLYGGFNDPGSIQFAFSADGSTFGEYSSAVNFNSYVGGGYRFECPVQTFDVSSLAGSSDVQLVRVKVNCLNGDASKWFFLTEVGFDGAVVPEPGTFGMVAIGLFGLLAYAWRKR